MQNDNLSELEKLLYNKHLSISRSERKKPFKFKKDFSDIVNTTKHKFLKRIATLFRKHPDIDFDTFFKAPYNLYKDVDYFDLEYFASMRAVRSYTLYKKQLFHQDPDTQIEDVKKSLRFIAEFCVKNNIGFYKYPVQKTMDFFTWMVHFKENKINIYTMMEFPNILSAVQTTSEETQGFFVNNFVENFLELHTKYNNSSVLKPYLKKAFITINEFVFKEMQNSQLTNKTNNLK